MKNAVGCYCQTCMGGKRFLDRVDERIVEGNQVFILTPLFVDASFTMPIDHTLQFAFLYWYVHEIESSSRNCPIEQPLVE